MPLNDKEREEFAEFFRIYVIHDTNVFGKSTEIESEKIKEAGLYYLKTVTRKHQSLEAMKETLKAFWGEKEENKPMYEVGFEFMQGKDKRTITKSFTMPRLGDDLYKYYYVLDNGEEIWEEQITASLTCYKKEELTFKYDIGMKFTNHSNPKILTIASRYITPHNEIRYVDQNNDNWPEDQIHPIENYLLEKEETHQKYPVGFQFDKQNKTIIYHYKNASGTLIYVDGNNQGWTEYQLDCLTAEKNESNQKYPIGFKFTDCYGERTITDYHPRSGSYSLDPGPGCVEEYITRMIKIKFPLKPLYDVGFTFVDYFGETRTIKHMMAKTEFDPPFAYVLDNGHVWKCSSLEEFLKEENS